MSRVPTSMRLAALPAMRSLSTKIPMTPRLVKSLLSQVGLKRTIDTGAFTAEELGWTVSLLRETDTLVNDMRASPRIITPVKGLNPAIPLTDDTVARVASSTLFLWGDEDPNGGPSVARAFAGRLPNSELNIIANAGHAPWIDQPDQCAQHTSEFLQR